VIPEDCCVLSYSQHAAYHGTLSFHPACKTFVDVNYDNISTLRLLKSIEGIADIIVEHRKTKKFANVAEFQSFCKQKGKHLSEEDFIRVVV
jgi:hypothetical protein